MIASATMPVGFPVGCTVELGGRLALACWSRHNGPVVSGLRIAPGVSGGDAHALSRQ
jgi:hypothetical protein